MFNNNLFIMGAVRAAEFILLYQYTNYNSELSIAQELIKGSIPPSATINHMCQSNVTQCRIPINKYLLLISVYMLCARTYNMVF